MINYDVGELLKMVFLTLWRKKLEKGFSRPPMGIFVITASQKSCKQQTWSQKDMLNNYMKNIKFFMMKG